MTSKEYYSEENVTRTIRQTCTIVDLDCVKHDLRKGWLDGYMSRSDYQRYVKKIDAKQNRIFKSMRKWDEARA